MILTRRKFIITAGGALAGGIFVPKFERWFPALMQRGYSDSIKYVTWDKLVTHHIGLSFVVSQEMIEDDIYHTYDQLIMRDLVHEATKSHLRFR